MNEHVVLWRCTCGHKILCDDETVERYSLIPGQDYEELILNEAWLFNSDEKSPQRDDLFHNQSQRIGYMLVCPNCDTLILSRPDGNVAGEMRYYREELRATDG